MAIIAQSLRTEVLLLVLASRIFFLLPEGLSSSPMARYGSLNSVRFSSLCIAYLCVLTSYLTQAHNLDLWRFVYLQL